MELCENCGKPATLYRKTDHGEVATCDKCKPGDWTGEARPVIETPPDLSNRETLSREEAAAKLGVSIDTFERYVLPELRVVPAGRRQLIPAGELEQWVKRNARRALR
jgi:hypothetical protein